MTQRTISRRNFVRAAGACIAGAGGFSANAAGPKTEKPNILYIMSDQQHWQALGCVDPFFDTPNLDAFASDAAMFERAFCTTPQCSPSRSSMMTGLYPSKTGVMGNIGAAGGEPLRTKNLGAMLQEAGYQTFYAGKWHLGDDPVGTAGWPDTGSQKDPVTTERSVAFLQSDQASKQPFGMVASYVDPHDVYHFDPDRDKAPEGVKLPESWFRETFKDKPPVHKQFMTENQGTKIWGRPQEVWEAYHDFYRRKVRLYDDHVGKILAALKESGLWEQTIVIVASDHGDMDTQHKLIFKGPFMYEHMMRIPLLVRVPKAFGGVARGRIADYDAVNVDLVPTIRDFAGLEPIECDGLSLAPLLTGATNPPRRDFVIGEYYSKQKWVNPIRMIRTSQFKYNKYIDHGEELYDLVNDRHEVVNLAGDPGYQQRRRALAADLNRWIKDNNDPFYSLETVPLNKDDPYPGRPRVTG